MKHNNELQSAAYKGCNSFAPNSTYPIYLPNGDAKVDIQTITYYTWLYRKLELKQYYTGKVITIRLKYNYTYNSLQKLP
jgi:hypothetical protein